MIDQPLTDQQLALIKSCAVEAEDLGQLHPKVLQLCHDEQWFKLFVPEVYGGPGKKLPEILRLEEALASADGSLGWTVTLCGGAAWFAGFLDPELAKVIFRDPKVCFAGSGAVGGTARAKGDGYEINGHWKYASGALHATIFTANCILHDENGVEKLDADGQNIIKSFILKKEEVSLCPGWDYFGLVATGSHAFEVHHQLVPANRSFEINANLSVENEGFDYPFLQLAETTLAVNSLGMAKHFLEWVEDLFQQRSGNKRFNEHQLAHFQNEYIQCKHDLELARTNFYKTFDLSWKSLIDEQEIEPGLLDEVSLASRKLAHLSRKITDALFPYCGLEAAKKQTTINRIWRDLHTASQHALLTFEK